MAADRLTRLRGARTITSKFTGDSHFAGCNDNDDYSSLPTGEIDTSDVEEALPDGTYLVTVGGDGAWTLRRSGRRQTAAGVPKVDQYGVLTGARSSARNVWR
jgi:hypothetical protein